MWIWNFIKGNNEMAFDERTEKNLATLTPQTQELARRFMEKAIPAMQPHGVVVKIISGLRTYAEQSELYAKGRSKQGPIVTRAKAGYSNHNFGTAFDIGLFRGTDYLEDSVFYEDLGPIGESVGLEWGGRWSSFKDLPHYQSKNGLTLGQMREMKAKGQPIP